MSIEDLQKNPKPWKQFMGGDGQGFNVPASLDVLSERTEENIATFLPNYLRLAGAVILLTFYLRPRALLGAAAVAYTIYSNLARALAAQQAQQEAGGTPAAARPPAADDPASQLLAAGTVVVTWVLVAYTRCLPIMMLSLVLAAAAVFAHAATRRGPSEYRYRGRAPLGFSLWQVLGRAPAPAGADPRLLFGQMSRGAREGVVQQARHLGRWAKFYCLGAWDAARRPFSRRGTAPAGWS